MKKTPAAIEVTTSAQNSAKFTALGRYPVRLDTVTAEVLARLLNYESLTSLDSVFDSSTTRLAAVVHRLESGYGWNIDRRDIAAGCNDGRVAWVTEYTINPLTIEAAQVTGAGNWCSDVRRARGVLRKKAAEAKRKAALANIAAAARRRIHPGQHDLFGVAAA